MTSINESGGLDEFLAAALQQSKANWDTRFTAAAVNEFMRSRFFGSGQTPTPPVGLTATEGHNEVELDWSDNPSTNLAGYNVYRSTTPESGYDNPINTSLIIDSEYVDTTATNGTPYYYVVTAVDNQDCESSPSTEIAVLPPGAPATPSHLFAMGTNDHQIDLTWDAGINNEAPFTFAITRRIGDGAFNFLDFVSRNESSYSDTSVIPGTPYTYRVRANRGAFGLFSDFSNQASVTPGVPTAPSDLIATAVSDTQIDLTWTDRSNNEDGFTIERKIGNGQFTYLTTEPPNATNYSNTGLIPGTTYTYRVRADRDAYGHSAFSEVAPATTDDPVGGSDLEMGLIGRWTFDEAVGAQVEDVSGNGHTATLIDGATLDPDHQQGSHAVVLNGPGAYVDLGSLPFGETFTIAVWAKLPSIHNDIQTLIANTTSGSSADGFKFFINSWTSKDRKLIFETGNGTSGAKAKTDTGAFPIEQWAHVTAVVNRSTGVAVLYVNASDQTVVNTTRTDFNTDSAVRVGRMTNGSYKFTGHIDDLRIYDRELTAQEIQTLVTSGG